MTVPYVFGNTPPGQSIPLSRLDDNFDAVGNSSNVSFIQNTLGAVRRTSQSKMSDVISVKDFGADPTGATDSTAAINAAIIAANSSGSSSVYLPTGLYKCASTVNMLSNVTLFGDGYGSALRFLPSGGGQTAGITVANKTNFSIRNLRVYGDGTSGLDLTWAIRIYGSTNGSVENCDVSTAFLGIFVGDITVSESYDIRICNNAIYNIGLNGIAVNTFGARINILGNIIYESGTISSLALVGGGIEFRGATNSVIGSNILDRLQYGPAGVCDGIRIEYVVEGATQQVRNVSVVNNSISNFSGFGIRGQFILNCSITGNTFYTSNATHESAIVLLGSDPNSVTSSNNTISGNSFMVSGVVSGVSAIFLEGGTTQKVNFNNITGNTVSGYRNGVAITNANNNSVSGNMISNCSAQGIFHVSGADNFIATNKCASNVASGIEVFTGTNIALSANECTNNAAYGIYINSGVTGTKVFGNVLYGNTIANWVDLGTSTETFNNIGVPLNKIGYGTAEPATGTWTRGNIVWNTTPSAGGTPGWVCVTSGTPGTWKPMANIAL